MPKSPLRRKTVFTPPPQKSAAGIGSPRWLAPLMCALFIAGLAWLVTWYISQRAYPIEAFGAGNMAVGFGFILAGFVLATRWK